MWKDKKFETPCPFCAESVMCGKYCKDGQIYLKCGFCSAVVFVKHPKYVTALGATRALMDEMIEEAGGIDQAFAETPSAIPERVSCLCCASESVRVAPAKNGRPHLVCPRCVSVIFINTLHALTGYRILAPSVIAVVESWQRSGSRIDSSVPGSNVSAPRKAMAS